MKKKSNRVILNRIKGGNPDIMTERLKEAELDF